MLPSDFFQFGVNTEEKVTLPSLFFLYHIFLVLFPMNTSKALKFLIIWFQLVLVIPHRIFDFISPIYDLIIKGSTPSELITFLNLQGNEKVLEIGTGTGRTVQKISSLCKQLYLLDPSQLMLNKARKKIPCANFSLGYAENLPYPNDFFQRVFAIDSFHHWNNHRSAAAEVYRVLSFDGTFILFEFDPKSRFGHFIRSMEIFFRMGSKFFTPEELRVLLKKESFMVTHQQYIDHMTYATIAQKSK